MEAKATLKSARLSPQKTRLVIDMIRGKGVQDALNILKFSPKRSAAIVSKLVSSAVANAEQKGIDDIDRLPPAEFLAVFKLVGLSARLQNAVFVLSFDPTVIENMLRERVSVDPAFLEKIVQKPEIRKLRNFDCAIPISGYSLPSEFPLD